MLELRDVVLKAGAEPIRHTFADGRISVVLGRNHSGKTLLTRVLAGLEQPVAGELFQDEASLAGLGPGTRSVALVYQSFVNYPNWTVRQNLASPMVAAKLDREAIESRVRDIAGKLGLSALLDRYPHTLSGGQQQRLAIGRALAKGARVLVMDEPLVNLDYKLRESLQQELRTLLHELGQSVIYTTSDPRDAFALGDELVLLADHAVLQSGAPLAVYVEPISPASADLMSDPRANRLPGKTPVLVRPEHLYLTSHAADDAAFPVTVLGRETNGSDTFLHCRLADASGDGSGDATHWIARLAGLEDLPPGSTCTLFAPRASLLRFDGDQGVRGLG
jgi:glycerol transport system ATP-binding protein